MLRREITLAFRDFKKNGLYWSVSVFSIALAVATVLVISHYVTVEKSYDKFNDNSENIFRVVSEYKDGEQLHKKAMAPGALGFYLKENSDTVDNFCAFSGKYGPEKIAVDTTGFFYTTYIYSTSGISKVFTFKFIDGSEDGFEAAQTALISETNARNWFGDARKAVGRVIKMQQADVTVVGVFKDFPQTSHFNPQFIVKIPERWQVHTKWDWPAYYTYLKVKDDASLAEVVANLNETNEAMFIPAIQKSNPTIHDALLTLQPLSDIHLNSNLEREIQANGSQEFITTLVWIAILILLTATFNFTNLYVTQFQNRLKEIGILKINGSSGWHLFQSYSIRALMPVLFSLALAMLFVLVLFPILPLDILKSTPDSFFEFVVIPSCLLFVFLLPVLVMYMIVLARNTTTAQLVRGKAPLRVSSSLFSITLLFQFVISGFLVGTTIVMYNQFSFVQNKNLGMNPSQVIRIKLASETDYDGKKLLDRLGALANVNEKTLTGVSPGEQPRYQKQEVVIPGVGTITNEIMCVPISKGFIETLDVKLLEGRNVTDWVADSAHLEALVNESFVKTFGLKDPLGLTFSSDYYYMGVNPKVRIVGIVQDFHFSTLHDKIGPMIFTNQGGNQALVRISATDVSWLLEEVKQIATDITGSSEYFYDFLDEHFAAGYRIDLERKNLFLFFSSLALIIACLGLFALSFKLVLSKSKETGVRKVFGSTTRELLLRYSISCTVHAFVGLVISIPLVYYYGNSWLDNFAYKNEIGISVFIISIFIVYSISFLTVLFNSYKAARLNPIDSLRVRE